MTRSQAKNVYGLCGVRWIEFPLLAEASTEAVVCFGKILNSRTIEYQVTTSDIIRIIKYATSSLSWKTIEELLSLGLLEPALKEDTYNILVDSHLLSKGYLKRSPVEYSPNTLLAYLMVDDVIGLTPEDFAILENFKKLCHEFETSVLTKSKLKVMLQMGDADVHKEFTRLLKSGILKTNDTKTRYRINVRIATNKEYKRV